MSYYPSITFCISDDHDEKYQRRIKNACTGGMSIAHCKTIFGLNFLFY